MKYILFILVLLVGCSTLVKTQYNGRVLVLKGRVFLDSNKNTVLDSNESGFGGIDVIPLDNAVNNLGQPLVATRTDVFGEYAYDGLMERVTYRFNISNPQGYLFENYDIVLSCPSGKTCVRNSSPSEGYKGTIVIENISGYQTPIISSPGTPRNASQVCLKIYIDLGPPETQSPRPNNGGIGVVGNMYTDFNSNGLKELNETWYAGLQLMLLDANGNVARDVNGNLVSVSVTDSNGRFQFENVAKGTYSIKVVGGVSSNIFNPNIIGPFVINSTIISTQADGVSSFYFQNLGQYGLIPKGNAICSGNVFYDFNWNLLFDGSDKPYPGVIVNIYDSVYGKLLFSVLTDEFGNWIVYGLVPGTKYNCNFIFNFNTTTSTGTPPSQCIEGGQTNINCGLDTVQSASNAPTNGTWPLGFLTTCFVLGEYNGKFSNGYTVVKIDSNATGYSYRPAPGGAQYLTKIAQHKDTGSVNGITYRPETGDIFVSSYYKRGTGFGPSGQGAIYRIANGTNAVIPFVDLLKIFGNDFTGPLDNHNFTNEANEMRLGRIYVSKVSLGDMDSTTTHLFVTNLYTNEVVQIPLNQVPTASNIRRLKVPNGGCVFESDWHIFAVKVYKGKIFVGGVCNGEGGSDQIDGLVVTHNGTAWETILQFPLGFKERGGHIWSKWDTTNNRPQPVVSQFAFLDNGDLAIGMRDRYSDGGTSIPYPDVYLACLNKYGDYELEENGKCGGRTSIKGYGAGLFPGGSKFLDTSTTRVTNVGVGVARAGPSQIVATGVDILGAYEGGVAFINTSNGTKYNRYQIYSQSALEGNFGKASGLGAITPIDPPAPRQPLECGRIWFDCNGNGIQDCSEIGIPNVKVYLYDQSNLAEPIASATSDSKGNFKFTTEPGKKYSCLIQSFDVENNFGPFVLSPVLNDSRLEYIDSDAVMINDNLIAGFNGTSFGAHIFTDCHFGIVKPNEAYLDGYGNRMSNGTCTIATPDDSDDECTCPAKQRLDLD